MLKRAQLHSLSRAGSAAWRQHARPQQRFMAAAAAAKYKHFDVSVVEGGVAVITYDRADNKVNALNLEVGEEMKVVMEEIESNPDITSSIIISGKPGDFIAGADITMFEECHSEEDFAKITGPVAGMFDLIEGGKPTVAAIHGSCLGGGLELALACNYRVATDSPRTVMGFPEVQLGILPGAGGTQRAPALIGLEAAMTPILTGGKIRAAKAKRMKLVDTTCDPNALRHAAIQAAQGLAAGTLKVDRGPKGMLGKAKKYILEETAFGRDQAFGMAKKSVMKMTGGNYPAPLAIIDVLRTSAEAGFGSDAGYAAEAAAFGKLGMTAESAALRSIFFGQTECKKNPYGKPKNTPTNVAVIGAGLMGAGVTEVSVANGFDATLKDASIEGLGKGMNMIEKNLKLKVKKRQMTSFECDAMMAKVAGVTSADDAWVNELKKADVVVEAVFENIDLKHRVFAELEEVIPSHCVLASNTSAIPIKDLAKGLKRPENFVGMHYFSPVNKMPLLEIITHEGTSDETAAIAFDVGLKQGKTPIIVKDVAGFFVNRCLGPYTDEGVALLQSGADINDLNKAMTSYGFPVGPMSLADEVGIEVAHSVGLNLKGDLGVRVSASDSAMLEEAIEMNMLGRKTGKGMFLYDQPKGPKPVNPEMVELIEKYSKPNAGPIATDEIQLRMVSRFVNEAAYCLQDDIIASPTVGDIGAVFGIGFPPFRGGPFRFLDSYGTEKLVGEMLAFQELHGDHFAPAQILVDYAKSGKKFHAE